MTTDMKHKLLIFFLPLIVTVATGHAQSPLPPLISPEVHPDRSVTFLFRAPNAQQVSLVRIIHERAANRGWETFGAAYAWSWRSVGRRKRLASWEGRRAARIGLIPSILRPRRGTA